MRIGLFKMFKDREERNKLKKIATFILNTSMEQLELTGDRHGVLIIDRKYGFIAEDMTRIGDEKLLKLFRKLAISCNKLNDKVDGGLRIGNLNISLESTQQFLLMIVSDLESEEKILSARLNIASLIDVIESQPIDDTIREIESYERAVVIER